MFGFKVPDVDEVMLISGGKSNDDKQFTIHRSAKFIFPGLPRKVAFLSLAQRKATIDEDCNDTNGLPIHLVATVAFKIGREDASIYAAGERFRDDQRRDTDMSQQTGNIFGGHLRSIAGDMSFDAIMRNRQELAEKVLGASKDEVANMGLLVDSFVINRLIGPQDYVDALSAPQRSAVAQAAAIAKSQADQASAVAQSQAQMAASAAEQESIRTRASYERDTEVAKAQYQAEVDSERKKALQAPLLADAKAQQSVLAEKELLAAREASLRQAQLQTEQIAPATAAADVLKIQATAAAEQRRIAAEAEATATTIQADADAHKMEVQAAALAAEGKVTLERQLIDQLPLMVKSAADGLAKANLTVFNGADGLSQLMNQVVGQGMSLFTTMRDQLDKADVNDEFKKLTENSKG